MTNWRIRIRLKSLQLTQWQADTIFGCMCWSIKHRHGDGAVQDFLKPFLYGDPSFLVSDGIPDGYLPLPFHLRVSAPNVHSEADYQKMKILKKIRFLPESEFFKVCQNPNHDYEIDENANNLSSSVSQLHATIDRITGTTTGDSDQASLYQLDGWVPSESSPHLSIFVQDRTGEAIESCFDCLKDMEYSGFGKKKSSGLGAFQIVGEPEEWKIPSIENANGFITISGFVPKQKDPTQGYWQYKVKHGKLGDQYAVTGYPFKVPWIVLQAGSVFLTDQTSNGVFGRMLENISPHQPEVVQYAYSYPLPIQLDESILGVSVS